MCVIQRQHGIGEPDIAELNTFHSRIVRKGRGNENTQGHGCCGECGACHGIQSSFRAGQGRSRLHDQGWCARQQAPAVVCSTVSRRCSDLGRSRGRRLQFSPSGPARWLATRHRLKQACSGDSNAFRSSTNLPSHWHTCNANGFLKGRCTDDEHQSRLLQAAQWPSRSRSRPSD